MGRRRDGREAAVQFLYQSDANQTPFEEALATFWLLRAGPDGTSPTPEGTRLFAENLIRGVATERTAIDAKIQSFAQNYQLNRIATVDRNILRVGFYEMLHCPEVPAVVAINECIEIAKKFGSDDSGRFVNGILDRLRKELPRSARSTEWRPRSFAPPGFPQVPEETPPGGGAA